MQPKSNTLFHFTKSQETLKLILQGGFWPRYCLEDVSWIGYAHDYIAYPMVCFCDIPLSRIAEHVDFYGEFGIGLTRQWAEANGLNPVLYVAGENNVTSTFRALNKNSNKHEKDEDKESAKISMRYLLAHSKPTAGKMVIDGQPVDKLFYQESEWRYVPKNNKIRAYLQRSTFDDMDRIEHSNQLTKEQCMLEFGPKDVRYIFVKSDTDIPDIINFIQVSLDHFPGADQKVLMSRVVSLESLSADL
ncbi:abortive infection system antitoxin AbiGi family protein [Paraburkholderia graminis]|uniref:abortive infection system antitoxin AbiGi family protein n=1 Tax=Paraburkholderia graminis TaxID=60548 RepID=UPI0038B83275